MISIITINRNNADGLRATMESVFAQTFTDFEYIVVDGASTDDSLDVVKEFDDRPKAFRWKWISEPDSGIYCAMNKGIRMSSGDYLLMLNSADTLVNEYVIERMMPLLGDADVVQGNVFEVGKDGKRLNRSFGKSDITFFDVLDGFFLHQAAFVRMSVYEEYGLYDESYKKNADTFFFYNVLGFGNASFKYVDVTISNYDTNGISGNPQWAAIDKEERERFVKENIPNRLYAEYQNSYKKIKLYNNLKQYKIVWLGTMLLARVANVYRRITQ